MSSLKFFPLGNADTCLITLRDDRRMLVDFADMRDPEDDEDRRCDLPALIREEMAESKQRGFAVAAFTHLDNDHCKGSPDLLWLDHASCYQGDGRFKVETLWVPASAITEEGLDDDARIIRQEARHRLREGSGIIVFSRPERLQDWMRDQGLAISDREHCFIDAGNLAPGFDLTQDGVEFFVHSPHAYRTDDRALEDRNGDSLVFQARFTEGGQLCDVLFSADVTHEVLAEIVDLTRKNKNDDRLHWNAYKLPHHCSYTALGPEKGESLTEPVEQVDWLCRTMGEKQGFVISSSLPIPMTGTPEDEDKQPPHRQAANYYRNKIVASRNFLVTMEHPNKAAPRAIVLEVTADGLIHKALGVAGPASIVSGVAPRAG